MPFIAVKTVCVQVQSEQDAEFGHDHVVSCSDLATGVVATAASRTGQREERHKETSTSAGQKTTDRLAYVASSAASNEITIEKRIDGISILTRDTGTGRGLIKTHPSTSKRRPLARL